MLTEGYEKRNQGLEKIVTPMAHPLQMAIYQKHNKYYTYCSYQAIMEMGCGTSLPYKVERRRVVWNFVLKMF